MISVREATLRDREAIRGLYLRAFPQSENEAVATLAVALMLEETRPRTVALVAELDGVVVGHVAFSPVTVEPDDGRPGYILAPLGVEPGRQRGGIGSMLVTSGMSRLSRDAVKIVFVYGDPAYYGRFGFRAEAASGYEPPYPLLHPFGWQAIALDGASPTQSTRRTGCVRALRDPSLW